MSLLGLGGGQTSGLRDVERSGIKVTIYVKPGLSYSLSSLTGAVRVDGSDDAAGRITLVQASVGNSIQGGGGFQLVCIGEEHFDPLTSIEADAWVNISLYRNDVGWHVMQGIIDEVRVSDRVEGTGASSRSFVIMGRSHQKVHAKTPVYFNNLTAENAGGMFLLETLGVDAVLGTPKGNVTAILKDFLRRIGRYGRAAWQMPPGIPGLKGDFVDSLTVDTSGYDEQYLPRFCATSQTDFPEVDLWTLAGMYADQQFCELYSCLLPPGGMDAYRADPTQAAGFAPGDSQMTIVFRDRPYVRVSPSTRGPIGLQSPWFSLPTHQLRRGDCTSIEQGISSQEAANSFTTVNALVQERSGQYAEEQFPLWAPSEMRRRGLCSMGGRSFYEADTQGLYRITDLELATAQQARLRDWYCLGHELRQGSIQLARGWPEIQVGSRVVIDGDDPEQRLTFYVESVNHSWSPMSMTTSLAVTRGYKGTDADFVAHLRDATDAYVLADDTPSATDLAQFASDIAELPLVAPPSSAT